MKRLFLQSYKNTKKRLRSMVIETRHHLQKNYIAISIPSLNQQMIDDVKQTRCIDNIVQRCDSEIKTQLSTTVFDQYGAHFRRLLIASTIAHNFAPYGESQALTFDEIVNQNYLNCLNYPILMSLLLPDENLIFLGFDGGYIGNHAQILFRNKQYSCLFDPTIGVVALTDYNSLLSGKKVREKCILSIFPKPEKNHSVNVEYHDQVIRALIKGLYKPSDALYFYENLATCLANHRKANDDGKFITPGGQSLRQRIAS